MVYITAYVGVKRGGVDEVGRGRSLYKWAFHDLLLSISTSMKSYGKYDHKKDSSLSLPTS